MRPKPPRRRLRFGGSRSAVEASRSAFAAVLQFALKLLRPRTAPAWPACRCSGARMRCEPDRMRRAGCRAAPHPRSGAADTGCPPTAPPRELCRFHPSLPSSPPPLPKAFRCVQYTPIRPPGHDSGPDSMSWTRLSAGPARARRPRGARLACSAACSWAEGNAHAARERRSWRKTKRSCCGGLQLRLVRAERRARLRHLERAEQVPAEVAFLTADLLRAPISTAVWPVVPCK